MELKEGKKQTLTTKVKEGREGRKKLEGILGNGIVILQGQEKMDGTEAGILGRRFRRWGVRKMVTF